MSRSRLALTAVITLLIAWGSIAGALLGGWEPKLGLDLQGGFSVVLGAPEGTDPEVLDKAVEIMRDRIQDLGSVQEPEISIQGDRNILVQLPGVTDRERALNAVGSTGQLSFRPVLARGTLPGISPAIEQQLIDSQVQPSEGLEPTTTTTTIPTFDVPPGVDPQTGLSIVDDPAAEAWLLEPSSGFIYHVGPAFLTGADIAGASAGFGQGWQVDPDFTAEGGAKFEAAAVQLASYPLGDVRRALAIVVDGEVQSAPVVQDSAQPLQAESVVITIGTGGDAEPQAEAEDLATILRYGALPTTFEREAVESVSATLGEDSLNAGLIAGLGGLVLVAVALVLYYRILDAVAVVGFTIFGSFLLLIIVMLGQFQGTTLTLAGVAGVIVSIGITADSYIVFFERIKEEAHRGRPLRSSVDHGFERAFHTIVTADTVTAVGAVLLYTLAIGPVKGFALTLGIATVIDVIVAYYWTRPAVLYLARSGMAEGGFMTIRGAVGEVQEVPA
ncbi:MAG: protein translocase subunit SecD [Acidimicrobiia bacterium]|nr:protein translocase subunit SecD [Acidimicrobiia bacterium]